MKTLRQALQEGKLTDRLRELLRKEFDRLEEQFPNSWDKKFTESILTYRKKLSASQIKQLERILQDPILEEEFPDDNDLIERFLKK